MHRRWTRHRNDSGGGLLATDDIRKVGVFGCCLMGSGIAQVAATSGYSTVVVEIVDSVLKKGMSGIERSLGKFVEKGTLTAEQRSEILGRLQASSKTEDL